jgi:hypothetical protein
MSVILNVTQDRISRIENQKDLKISTLRKMVQAMGGNLYVFAEFPDELILLSDNPILLSDIVRSPKMRGSS